MGGAGQKPQGPVLGMPNIMGGYNELEPCQLKIHLHGTLAEQMDRQPVETFAGSWTSVVPLL